MKKFNRTVPESFWNIFVSLNRSLILFEGSLLIRITFYHFLLCNIEKYLIYFLSLCSHQRHRLLIGMACQPCFGWVVMLPQSCAKNQFYCTVYNRTLKTNCESHRLLKNMKIIVEDRVKSLNYSTCDLSEIFYFFKVCLHLRISRVILHVGFQKIYYFF